MWKCLRCWTSPQRCLISATLPGTIPKFFTALINFLKQVDHGQAVTQLSKAVCDAASDVQYAASPSGVIRFQVRPTTPPPPPPPQEVSGGGKQSPGVVFVVNGGSRDSCWLA